MARLSRKIRNIWHTLRCGGGYWIIEFPGHYRCGFCGFEDHP